MAPPATYSESIFADYLASVLGSFADVLGWDAGSVQVIEAVNDTLIDLSVSDIATVSNMRALRALGRRAIWRAVVQATASDYTITDNGQTLTREQLQKQATVALEMAEHDCLEFSPSYRVTLTTAKRSSDPYIVLPDVERVR